MFADGSLGYEELGRAEPVLQGAVGAEVEALGGSHDFRYGLWTVVGAMVAGERHGSRLLGVLDGVVRVCIRMSL